MKKLQLLTLILVAVMTATTSSKCTQSKAAQSDPKASVAGNSRNTLALDSIKYHYANADSTLTCDIIADCPKGDDTLSVSIKRFLSTELATISIPNVMSDDSTMQGTYKGDIHDAKAIIDYYGEYGVSVMRETLRELSEDIMPGYKYHVCYDAKMRLVEKTDKYLTYDALAYAYTGGAHDATMRRVTNIVKATGKPLTQSIDTTKIAALQPILKKGIASYIHQFDAEVNEKNVLDGLFVEENTIPLPASAPYLAKDGVHFVYGHYEIAPYAVGIIEFKVDYDTIKPYLTREALRLID